MSDHIAGAAAACGSSYDDICGRAPSAKIARNAVILALREVRQSTLPQIGLMIGNRDHTTIIHALKRGRDWLGVRHDFSEKYEAARDYFMGITKTTGEAQAERLQKVRDLIAMHKTWLEISIEIGEPVSKVRKFGWANGLQLTAKGATRSRNVKTADFAAKKGEEYRKRIAVINKLIAKHSTWDEIADAVGMTRNGIKNFAYQNGLLLTPEGKARAYGIGQQRGGVTLSRRMQSTKSAEEKQAAIMRAKKQRRDNERLAELIAQGQALAGKGKRIERAEPEYVERRFLTRSAEHCWPSVSTAA